MRRTLQSHLALLLIVVFSGLDRLASAEKSHVIIMPTGVSERRFATEMMWPGVRNLPVGRRPRIILVLGGGGARGLCHIGVLKVFEEEKIPIDQIVGVSVGALIGALYAGGLPAEKIETMANEVGWNELTNISKTRLMNLFLNDNLISTDKMEAYLRRQIGDRHFSDLRIPFACVATDIRTGERVIFQEGPVAIAARASATIPGLFEQVEYRHRSLIDGGLVDNLPTDIVNRQSGDIVVAVLPEPDESQEVFKSVLQILVRSIEIQKDVINADKKKLADFLIEPPVGAISMIDLDKNREAIESGMKTARRQILDLKALILSRISWSQLTQQSRQN